MITHASADFFKSKLRIGNGSLTEEKEKEVLLLRGRKEKEMGNGTLPKRTGTFKVSQLVLYGKNEMSTFASNRALEHTTLEVINASL